MVDAPNQVDEPVSQISPGSFRELFGIAIPLMISMGTVSIMHVIDRILLLGRSESEMAASMPAGLLYWAMVSLLFGMSQYTATFVSQYEGSGRKDRVCASVWQNLWMMMVFSVPIMLTSFWAEDLFRWLDHAQELQQYEQQYFSILAVGTPSVLMMTVLSGFFSGRGQTRVIMIVNLISLVINAIADYVLIYGAGPIPSLGIRGAAYATVFAQVTVSLCYLVLVAMVSKANHYPFWKQYRVDFELMSRMFWNGLPMGFQMLVEVSGFTVFTIYIGQLGETALAATNLTFSLNSMVFIPMLGLGTAVMTLVGRRIGEGKPELASQTVWLGAKFAFIYVGLWCLIYLGLPNWITYPYLANANIENPAVLEHEVRLLLRYVALYSLFDAMAVVFGYAIRGAGDNLFPLLLAVIGCPLLLVLPLVVLSRLEMITLHSCWISVSVYIVVVGFGMFFRFLAGHWKKASVIERSLIDHTATAS